MPIKNLSDYENQKHEVGCLSYYSDLSNSQKFK